MHLVSALHGNRLVPGLVAVALLVSGCDAAATAPVRRAATTPVSEPAAVPGAVVAPTPSPIPDPIASEVPAGVTTLELDGSVVAAADAQLIAAVTAAQEEAVAQAEARAAAEAARRRQVAANKDLQERLAELGFYTGAIDGDIGPASTSAVRAFQDANALAVDGVVGARTRAALASGDVVDAVAARAAQAAILAATAADDDVDNDSGGSSGSTISPSSAQQRLRDLGYWGGSMTSALMAFQKVNGLSVDGSLGPNTAARLGDPRSPSLVGGTDTRIEVDLDRQVVHLVRGGSRVRTMNASSGNGETFQVSGVGGVAALTPVGTFTIQRRISGLREGALGGMYDPMYFFHGWALHGSNSVPAYPASHGCVRLSRSDASWLFGQVPDGTQVRIHGSRNSFVPGGPDQPPIL